MLHLVDHATRYSIGVRLPSKESSDILTAIFKHCVAYFGVPGAFLTVNSREFDNQFFQDMAQNQNNTTTAQFPWSNGLNERHNSVLGVMVKKHWKMLGVILRLHYHGLSMPRIHFTICMATALTN